MKEPTVLDTAELRLEFRRLYNEKGPVVALQVFYELLISAQVCLEVINEEAVNEKED